jgi:SAM-dependent methyltransferase
VRKRDFLRILPGGSKLVQALDTLTAENRRLTGLLHQMIFQDLASSAEPGESEGNGPPIPGPALRFLVAGTDDREWFLEAGRLGAQTLTNLLARQGQTLGQFRRILDFGCGCGRVIRHLNGTPGVELHGSDCNAQAIRWCQRHLGFAEFRTNALEPPLPYPDGTFDLIYSFSIFTHLTAPLQARWMADLRRALVPGGYLILSLHGDKYAESLSPAERSQYRNGRMVVREQGDAGLNNCSAFHPEAYVRQTLAQGFEVIDFIPEGAKGNAPQDVYLMKSQP